MRKLKKIKEWTEDMTAFECYQRLNSRCKFSYVIVGVHSCSWVTTGTGDGVTFGSSGPSMHIIEAKSCVVKKRWLERFDRWPEESDRGIFRGKKDFKDLPKVLEKLNYRIT